MGDLSITEFKGIIADLADRYPTARVDFVYPVMRAGKRITKLGHFTGFSLLRSSHPILRFNIDYARADDEQCPPTSDRQS